MVRSFGFAHPGTRTHGPQLWLTNTAILAHMIVADDNAETTAADEGSAYQESPHRGWHSRGYHPHFDSPEKLQSITFRLHDSVPLALIERWRDEIGELDPARSRQDQLMAQIADYEDAGIGDCWLKDPRIGAIVESALLHFDGQQYRLLEWCVMPNHVHALVEVLLGCRLAAIVQGWKSHSARRANRVLNRTGAFWMLDYFDRYVRNEAHLTLVREYIRMNPVKAKLCERPEQWRWSSASKAESRPV